jgi:predicted nuclease of predicted toxin-antitoxin system
VRFLADESCDFATVRALRAAGHDVLAVADAALGAADADVLALAAREGRVLLTEDKDFGQLARAGEKRAGGVVLLRYPRVARTTTTDAVVRLAEERGEDLHSRFVVVEPGRVRVSPDPAAAPAEAEPSPTPESPPAKKSRRRGGKK